MPPVEPADAAALEAMAQRLEDMADNMARWCPGAGIVHRVGNTRMLLMGEAYRLRCLVQRMREGR